MTFTKLVEFFQHIEATSKRLEMAALLAKLFAALDDPDETAEVVYLCQGQLRPPFENIEFGMSEKLVQKAVVHATGSSDSTIATAFRTSGDLGSVIEGLGRASRGTLPLREVYRRLSEIAALAGAGSVDRKVLLLSALLRAVHCIEAKYVVRIVMGKLRLGVGDATVVDGLARSCGEDAARVHVERAYNLCSDLGLVGSVLKSKGLAQLRKFSVIVGCPIRPALAGRLARPDDIIAKIGPCAVEEKFDGFRVQVHKNGDTVKIFSRNQENISAMFPELVAGTLAQVVARRAIFEGEAMAFDAASGRYLPFQVTVQRKRKHDIAAMRQEIPLRIFVFDLLFADEDLTGLSFRERRRRLDALVRPSEADILLISPLRAVETARALNEIFEESVAQGREGIIAKRWDAPYQAGGRNFNWIKLKRSYSASLADTIDAVIIGYYYGKGARAAAGIGSLLVAVYDRSADRYKTVAKVGSGWTESEMGHLKELLQPIRVRRIPEGVDALLIPDEWVEPKYVVEIQADEITLSPVHTCGKGPGGEAGYALRFPRAVGLVRIDKHQRDATTVDEIRDLYALQGRRG